MQDANYDELNALGAFGIRNKDTVIKSDKCGCYYCLKIFPPAEVVEWVPERPNGETAICPYCGIDSVMGEYENYPLTSDLLKLIKVIRFS